MSGASEVRFLLDTARDLLARPRRGELAGTWPRAAALLIRQALEAALDQYWRDRGLALHECNARAQWICLADYERKDPATVAALSGTWHALSRACHHHAYELPPTAAELRGWLDVVERWHSRTTG